MAKMTRSASKETLARQQAQLRRDARGRAHVGESEASSAGRASELERVRRVREQFRAQERAKKLRQPLLPLAANLVIGVTRLTRTVVVAPFRMAAAALRGLAPHASQT